MTEHPGEQFPPDVDPDVEPAFEPYPSEKEPEQPDYDTEPAPQGFSYDGSAAYGETGADTEQAFEASLEQPHSDQPETAEQPGAVEQPEPVGQPNVVEQPEPVEQANAVEQPETAESAEMVEPVEHVDPAEVEFGPEFARAPGEEHEHPFAAESAVPPPTQQEAPPEDAAQDEVVSEGPTGQEASPEREAVPEDVAQHAAPFEDAGPDEAQGEEGHVLVEEVRRRLDGLGERAVSEHAEVYADLHERLQDALVEADADSGDRA